MLRKVPFVRQEGIMDCGAASLLMIIKYYRGQMSLGYIREITQTNQKGTTAFHIIKAAQEIGFKAKGIKCQKADLFKIKTPAIAHVTIADTYQHYVVIYRVKKNFIIIADPANKIKKISWTEFLLIWNKVVIVLNPQKQLPKFQDQKKITINNILVLVQKEVKFLIPLALLTTLFSIANTYYFKFIIDALIASNYPNYLFLIFICFVFINLLYLVTNFFKNKILIFIKMKIDSALSLHTFHNIISLPYKYYCSYATGEIVSRIHDLQIVKNMVAMVLFVVFIDLPITLFALFFLYLLSWELFFVTLFLFCFFIVLLFAFRSSYQKYINLMQEQKAHVNTYTVELISNYETVKGLGLENSLYQKLVAKQNKLLLTTKRFDDLQNTQNILKKFFSSFSFLVLIYYGALLIQDDKLTIGALLTFNTLFFYFLEPIKSLIEFDVDYQEMKNALRRISELFWRDRQKGYVQKKIKGNLLVQNLNYAYDEVNNILKNVNLEVSAGEKIMIYGPSGSGKSTLLKILKNYYQITREKVFYEGTDINDYYQTYLAQNVTFISQKEKLFNDTLLNNLKLKNKNHRQIHQMIKLCCINEVLDQQLGVKMMIEENAHNISGGQRQRIALARGMLSNNKLVLIDEGFSEMDSQLEKNILKNLFTYFSDTTFIIVSHRIVNKNLFDKIYYFQDGNLKYAS